MKRDTLYALTECYKLLDVDPKTLRDWLQKAGIEPQPSKADPRVKYLTEDQVRYFEDHKRSLTPSVSSQENVTPPNTYKLHVEQVDAEHQISDPVEQLRQLHEAVTNRQSRHEQELTTLRDTFTDQIREIRKIEEQTQHRLQEGETALTEQGQAIEKLRNAQAAYAEGRTTTLREHRKEIEILLAQHSREVDDALQGLNKEVAAVFASLTERLEKIETRLDQLATNGEATKIIGNGWQHRADTQDEQISVLRNQLQEEKQAREALARQIADIAAQETPKRPRKPTT